ncbi:hypothetical protein DMA11_16970 [Marinilabiliaceae bacterium JC017]|nr:hypothetical protein DMA11_16970 [Marinilabiliaceae bacterium JC017]
MINVLKEKFEETKQKIKSNNSINERSSNKLNNELEKIFQKVKDNIDKINHVFCKNDKAKYNVLLQLYSKYSEFIYINEDDIMNVEILFRVVDNLEEREDSISLLLDSFNLIYNKKQ